jgi:hypothetical protein
MSDETLRIEDAINETCPWSGKPIAADSLTLYRGEVVGFCNPGCRDKFEQAITRFERARAGAPPPQRRNCSGRPARPARTPTEPPTPGHPAFASAHGRR